MRWFGQSWNAPVCNPETHHDTPVGELCQGCVHAIKENDQGVFVPRIINTLLKVSTLSEPYHLRCWLHVLGVEPLVGSEDG